MAANMRLDGRVAVVTGAASGIGAATAALLGEKGARLVLLDRAVEELEDRAAALRSRGIDVVGRSCDVADDVSIADAFAFIASAYDRLDICFSNAGYGRYGELRKLKTTDWRKHLDVNLTGAFRIAQEAANRMAACGNGGSIIFTASVGAVMEVDLFGAYSVSKAAMPILAKTMASEYGADRIRVNVVMPGVIETGMTGEILSQPALRAHLEAETPMGRLGRPEDVAEVVAFLASDAAEFVTGTSIPIDGGQTIHGIPRWFRMDYRKAGNREWKPGHLPLES